MEDPPPITLSQPQKRPLEDDDPAPVVTPTKAPTAPDSRASTPLSVLSNVATPSPLKNSIIQPFQPQNAANASIGDNSVDNLGTMNGSGLATTPRQPAKRRKLTAQEKEEKRLEKEAKDKAKAEQKAQKEAEKQAKEEEKRKKQEEKEEKKKVKEAENQQKEEEKRKKEEEKRLKEEEKLKKERAQMKLGAFFVKAKPGAEASVNTTVDAVQTSSTEAISLEPDVTLQDANSKPSSPQKAIQKKALTDYERYFLPFQLPSRAILAPYNRFMEDPVELNAAVERLEKLKEGTLPSQSISQLQDFKRCLSPCGARGVKHLSVVEIVERINSSSDHPIDLTDDGKRGEQDPIQLLKHVPMKYLHFGEDVRPPYYGTYTTPHTDQQAAHLARNPFSRGLKHIEYDYDSEIEWEEPEEGEDLDSEGDDDLEDDGDDDMEGFLDDEEDPQLKRRLINGDLEPVSTGLCWEDTHRVSRLNDGSGAICTDFKGMELGFLLEPQPQSIDPFSTAYWAPEPMSVPVSLASNSTASGTMNPPRLPLSSRPVNGMLNTLNVNGQTNSVAVPKPAKPPKRMIPNESLPAFKDAVQGSDLTKIALIEHLKKQFPKLPKDAISNTLTALAKRVGPKEVEKRWVLI